MYIRRAENKNDRHSGYIAFPGGKCDNQETDIQTVFREIQEEIGIDLCSQINDNSFYLGKMPNNILGYHDDKN